MRCPECGSARVSEAKPGSLPVCLDCDWMPWEPNMGVTLTHRERTLLIDLCITEKGLGAVWQTNPEVDLDELIAKLNRS